MNTNRDDSNEIDEEELELKRYIKQGSNLKWTWIIGLPVIYICIMFGDPSQWLLAILVAAYIYISTTRYFK